MKQWPMLMRGPLVRAVLAGPKTVTRRLDLRWLKAKPGDLIWVKETWATISGLDVIAPRGMPTHAPVKTPVFYLADGPNPHAGKTRVSIHMPKWASRLWLEVVSVREERVQDITEEDAKREGLTGLTKDGSLVKWGIPDRDGWPGTDDDGWPWTDWNADPRAAFRRLWDSINGTKPGCAWADNPLVARIEFKRVERPADGGASS